MSLAGAWKQLRWSSGCGQSPLDSFRLMYEQRQKQKPNEVTSVIIEGHLNRFCYLLTHSLTYFMLHTYVCYIPVPLYMWFHVANKLYIKTANNIVKQTSCSLPTKTINQPKYSKKNFFNILPLETKCTVKHLSRCARSDIAAASIYFITDCWITDQLRLNVTIQC